MTAETIGSAERRASERVRNARPRVKSVIEEIAIGAERHGWNVAINSRIRW